MQCWFLGRRAMGVLAILCFSTRVFAQEPLEPEPEQGSEPESRQESASEPEVEPDPVPQPVEETPTGETESRRGAAETAVEVIEITGTKKVGGELASDAPVAVTAFNTEQLDALQFRDLESLTFSIPNVSLDAVGTQKGVANFSIRGLGANSSIPTIDPTVGLFVNGVYMGSNVGAVLDTFDLEAVEVLRGPQGVLFGRNVTGGAVLLRTRRPGDELAAQFKANLETGLEYRLYGGVDVPIIDELLKTRVSFQWRDDAGWFTNFAPVENPTNPLQPETEEREFGAEQTWLVRPTATITPTDDLTIHITYEHGETEAAGPASQSTRDSPSPGVFDDFDFSIDNEGFADYTWDQVFTELVWDLGDAGTITNIFGYRNVESIGSSDIDSQPIVLFHTEQLANIEHFSEELRYSNRFADLVDFTLGGYLFSQTIEYRERRELVLGAVDSTLGGNQDQLSLGAFTAVDIDITDRLTLLTGVRFTYEEKDAEVATFNPTVEPCGEPLGLDCDFDFVDSEDWNNISPKVGAKFDLDDANHVYGHWTRGFRSGGYNMRNTLPGAAPGPFDEETQDVFELGAKGAVADNDIRYGVAGFVTLMQDLQREVNIPVENVGVAQIIQNTADATLYGVELESSVTVTDGLVLLGSFGYTDAQYRDVRFDLNEDGVVDDGDEDLTLPRLANITANAGVIYDIVVGDAGILTLRGNYAYRDDSFFTDNNLGALPSGNVIDASVAFSVFNLANTGFDPTFTLYGRNLANEAFLGGQTPLPPDLGEGSPPLGGNFSPLKEGRVLGAEMRVDF